MKRLILTASVIVAAWGWAQTTQLNAQRVTEQQNSTAEREEAVRRVIAIGDEFVGENFVRYPARYPASGRDGEIEDNSLAAVLRWQQKEDGWITALRLIDPARLVGTPAWVVHGTLSERLEALRESRVCREELWRMSGGDHWLTALPSLAARQPVGTPESRKLALARFGMLPQYLDTEIANLRRGLEEGYSTPKVIVERNIRQLDALSRPPAEASLLFGPARRDSTQEFVSQWRALLTEQIQPALNRYRNFLRDEYLPAAREAVGLSAHPNGDACFRALVRNYTSLRDLPEDLYTVYLRGLEQARTTGGQIGKSAVEGGSIRKTVQDLVARPESRFNSREEVIPAAEALVRRFEAQLPKFFTRVPPQPATVGPIPALREESAAFGFHAGKGLVQVNLSRAMEPGAKLRLESMVFHETGHHVQASLTSGRLQIHRALVMLRQPVFNEGWGDYVAQLALEQGLFSADAARVFEFESGEGHAGNVVQAGLHLKGWSRAQAIDFLSQYTTRTDAEIAAAVDRRIALPGETLAYSAGKIRILELRARAKQALGSRFDLREFHDRVLEYGSVPLPMLTDMIERWIESKRTP
jgi:uncharacterized protein (DUF885 family)